jgi:hypothetical protein
VFDIVGEIENGYAMSELVTCKHCSETGTCRNGQDGTSCDRCSTYWRQQQSQQMPKDERFTGMVCSVCFGRGLAETASSQWDYRFPGLLAVLFIAAAFGLLFYFEVTQSAHFDKVLVFVSTLVGSVTGYYFGGERRRRTVQVPKVETVVEKSNRQ